MSIQTILDRLLDQSTTTESQEHVLEQAHYAMDSVQQRLLEKFETLVEEINGSLGAPEFNASCENTDSSSHNPVPSWVMGSKQASNSTYKITRLSYWRRDTGVSYLLLRQELDSKDRPTYYDVVLGGRRRTRTDTARIGKLRDVDTSFLGWLKRLLSPAKRQ